MDIKITKVPEFILGLHFEMGERVNNKERSFLFISKILGKHLPTNPELLFFNVERIVEQKPSLNDDSVIIGFAETATGFAGAIAYHYPNCYFGNTTRKIREEFD